MENLLTKMTSNRLRTAALEQMNKISFHIFSSEQRTIFSMTSLFDTTDALPTKWNTLLQANQFFSKQINPSKHFFDLNCCDWIMLGQKSLKFDFRCQLMMCLIKKIFCRCNLLGKNLHLVGFATVCFKTQVILFSLAYRKPFLLQCQFSICSTFTSQYAISVSR